MSCRRLGIPQHLGRSIFIIGALGIVLLSELSASGFACCRCFWEEIDRQGPTPVASRPLATKRVAAANPGSADEKLARSAGVLEAEAGMNFTLAATRLFPAAQRRLM